MKSQSGFALIEGVIAVGIFGVLVAGLAHLANQSYMQQSFLSDRDTAVSLNMALLELLSKREACQNSFAGLDVSIAQSPSEIRGTAAAEVKYQVGQRYGPENSRFLLQRIVIEPVGDILVTRKASLRFDLVRQKTGFGATTMLAKAEMLVVLDGSNQIITCVAVGRDLNQPWIESAIPPATLVHLGNNVGIGTSNPAHKLSLVGPDPAAVGGRVKAIGYYEPSDARLKEIESQRDGLKDIESIRGVRYRWVAGGGEQLGVLAQDVRNTWPEAVSESNGYLLVNYDQIIPSLIEAYKQLHRRHIDLLKSDQSQERELGELRIKLKSLLSKAK